MEGHSRDIMKTPREAVRERLLRSDHVRPGRDSITWTINREMIVVAGWGRAILLQLAHPAVAAGVHDHSYFRGSLLSSFRRLRSSIGAMLSLTFGDTEQMIAAAAGINSIHNRVRGHVRDGASERYSAHDPELQRWVHATLLESIPLTYELLVRPLTLHERDRYCSEAAIMEPLLGMPAGWLPARLGSARGLHARDAGRREDRRHRHQPDARTSGAVSAPVARGLAGIPGDAARHDRIASAGDPPGIRLRLERARRADVRAMDGSRSNIPAAASTARPRVADGKEIVACRSNVDRPDSRTLTARRRRAAGSCRRNLSSDIVRPPARIPGTGTHDTRRRATTGVRSRARVPV